MAQRVFNNFKEALDAEVFNTQKWGILPNGRYAGFGTFTPSTLNFTIGHSSLGAVAVDEAGALVNPTGVLVTKQGIIIQESSTLGTLTCATNLSNAFERWDAVCARHTKVDIVGGTPATYEVITGVTGSNNDYNNVLAQVAAATNPNQLTIIGYIKIAASVATLAAATWVPLPQPIAGLGKLVSMFAYNGIGTREPTEAWDVVGNIKASGNMAAAGNITSSAGVVGYATGAGGTVTQLTSQSTAVTINKISGRITMFNALIGAGASVSFLVNNDKVTINSVIILNIQDQTNLGEVLCTVDRVSAGSFYVHLYNTGSAFSNAPKLNFAVINAPTT